MDNNKIKLIVGLGNPEEKYKYTRHNIGRMFLDYIKSTYLDYIEEEVKKDKYHYFKVFDTIYLSPDIGMNDSGIAVKEVINANNIDINDVLIIMDDINLPCSKIRLRYSGSDGRHKGLASIIKELNSENIARLKIGIDKSKDKSIILIDYVLGNFTMEELYMLFMQFAKIQYSICKWKDESDRDKVLTYVNG